MLFALRQIIEPNSTKMYIDLLGYRKYGHNEGDEPRFTQPKLYDIIANHPNPRKIYKRKLLQEGIVSDEIIAEMEQEFKLLLDENFEAAKEIERNQMSIFMEEDWRDFSKSAVGKTLEKVDTIFDLA